MLKGNCYSSSESFNNQEYNLPERYNAAELLYHNIDIGNGDNPAIYWEDKTYTYAQITEMASRIGNSLKNSGIPTGSRVMMLMLDTPEFPSVFFGAMQAGYIPIPTNTVLPSDNYEYFLKDSQAQAIIVSAPIYPKIAEIRDNCPDIKLVVVIGDGGAANTVNFAEWIKNSSTVLDCAATIPDDQAFWLYTSGSTGLPKGVVYQHKALRYATENYAKQVLKINNNDIVFSASKAFHGYGLGNSLLFPSSAGAVAVLLTDRPTPERVFTAIDRFKPTLFFAVPTLYTAMLSVPDGADKYDMSSIRLGISAAEPLPPQIYEQWYEKFGVEILDGIGSTEMLHIFLSNQAGKSKAGTSGRPVPGYEAKILDPKGNPVQPGETGDLFIKGGSAAASYWNKPEKTAATMREGWVFTGDRYCQDDEGYYLYKGRSDDVFKVSGQWISPIEVENTLIEHPAVFECAVIAAQDADNLQRTKAVIVLSEGYTGNQQLTEELQKHVKSHLAPYKYPRIIEYVAELPKTVTGKIQRFRLRETSEI